MILLNQQAEEIEFDECEDTFLRYIRLHELGTVWASGFQIYPLGPVHGRWSALGEFICARDA